MRLSQPPGSERGGARINISHVFGRSSDRTFQLSTDILVLSAQRFLHSSWHIPLISPYRKHATTTVVVVGGNEATSKPAVINLRCIMEDGYDTYSSVGSSTCLGIRVPGTWYQVHFCDTNISQV